MSCESSLTSLQSSNHFPILTLTPLVSSSELSYTVSLGAFGILFCQQPFIYPNRFSCLWISERKGWDLEILPWQISFTVESVRAQSRLFATLMAAHQAPLSMGLSRQGYRSGLPSPTLGDLPDPGIESPALAGELFTTKPPGKPASFTVGKFIFFLLGYWICLLRGVQGEMGFIKPLKKALSPSTRAMSAYLLRIFITERIYMKTLAWRFHPVA